MTALQEADADERPVADRESVARRYFPDERQWATAATLLGRQPLDALIAEIKPSPWAPVELSDAARQAVSRAREHSPFAASVALLGAAQLAEVEAALDRLGGGCVDLSPGAVVGVLADLLVEQCGAWTRVLVSDMRQLSERGALVGATPEARHDSYLALLTSDEHLARLARTQPVLVAAVQACAAGRARQVDQISAAGADLRDHFGAGRIDRLRFGSGDSHAGGRSVCVLTLADGGTVLHKPRGMALERGFYDFAATVLAECGEEFVQPRIVEGDGGALMEFLVARTPGTPEEFRAYVRNLGRMAAIVHLLDGYDVHHENVVAQGTMPVPVDLECLFRGRTLRDAALPASATASINDRLKDSVLSTMVLPSAVNIGGIVFQVGAGGMVTEQLSPVKSLRVRNPGRDDMSVTLERRVVTAALTVPEVEHSAVPGHDVMDLVAEGVRSALEAARRLGEDLVAHVEHRFAGLRARFLNAPSLGYGQLLRMLTHPSLGADPTHATCAAARALLLSETGSEPLLTAEIRDLLAGDVPLFEFDVDGTDVWSWRGDLRDRVFAEPPKQRVVARLRGLDDQAIQRQAVLAALSFVGKLEPETEVSGYRPAAGGASRRSGDRTLLAVARSIGDDLVERAVPGVGSSDVTNWEDVRIAASGEGLWTPGAMDQSVYGGFSGVAVFLHGLGLLTGERRYLDTASSVLEPYARQCEDLGYDVPAFPIGASAGHAGVASAMLWYGRTAGRPEMERIGWGLLRSLVGRLRSARDDDHLSGVGGVLAVATSWRAGHEAATEVARACIEELARRRDDGSLLCAGFTGFAHGASGVLPYARAWPDLPEAGGVVRELEGALDGLFIDPRQGWHTSRRHTGRAYGWCHGSPGIALGELLTLEGTGRADDERLATALRLAGTECFGRNFSLCHGDLGTTEVLLHAGRVTGESWLAPTTPAELVEHTDRLLRSARPPRGAHTASLMVGRTGLGYAALRFLDPDLPPVLWSPIAPEKGI